MTRGRTSKLMVVAAVAALALTACSSGRPGAAAIVDGKTISVSSADQFASALCVALGGQPSGQMATKQMRITAMQIMITAEASNEYGKAQGATYDPTQLNNAITQNQALFDLVDPSYRSTFAGLVESYMRGQMMMADLGRKVLTSQGQTSVDDQTALNAGMKLLADKGPKIQLDPRFGKMSNGQIALASGSLSVPVSDTAVNGNNINDAAWIASLPAFQKCG